MEGVDSDDEDDEQVVVVEWALGGGGGAAWANGIGRSTRRGMRGRTCVGAHLGRTAARARSCRG